jgi:hypothetical protein
LPTAAELSEILAPFVNKNQHFFPFHHEISCLEKILSLALVMHEWQAQK